MGRVIQVALLAASVLPAGDSPEELHRQASRLFSERRLHESYTVLERALDLNPRYVPALLLQGRIAMALERFDVAGKVLLRAVEAEPDNATAYFLYGFQLHLQNELLRAIGPLEKARALNPSDARPSLYLALTRESLGEIEAALLLYREAIAREEAAGNVQADTLLSFARSLFVLDRLDEAEPLIERAAGIDPNSRDPHYEKARLCLKRGRPGDAAVAARQALERSATGITDWQVHYLLVQAYRLSNNAARADWHAAEMRRLEGLSGKTVTGRSR